MMQKFRADKKGDADINGAIPFYAIWFGGPTLAKILNCPVERLSKPRTSAVYITGEADTYFSLPACTRIKGKYIRGYVTGTEDGHVFRPYDDSLLKIPELI